MAEELSSMKTRKTRKPGINKDGKMSVWWSKFHERLRTYNDVPTSQWQDVEILGYICHRFEQAYGVSFSFALKGAPSKCQEIFCIKQAKFILDNDNPAYFKDYVDYVFDTKIIPKGKKLISMAYFMNAGICNEFKLYHKNMSKIKKTTPLPKDYMELAIECGLPDITTYGDVAFAKMAIDAANDPNDVAPYKNFFDRLLALAFDKSVLVNMED